MGKVVALNKKARYEYQIIEEFDAGLVLTGTEVKSLRAGRGSISEGYIRPREGELYLVGANIPEYTQGNIHNHDP